MNEATGEETPVFENFIGWGEQDLPFWKWLGSTGRYEFDCTKHRAEAGFRKPEIRYVLPPSPRALSDKASWSLNQENYALR